MPLNTGTYISGIGHGVLIVWALVGGFFLRADDPLPVQTTEVSLLTSEEFAALVPPLTSPDLTSDVPNVDAPTVEDAPQVTPSEDTPPETPQPETVAEPEQDAVPDAPEIQPLQTDVTDDAPETPEPPSQDSAALMAPTPDATPKPTPSPRIAPEPAAEPAPDSQIADTVTPEVVPDEAAETPAEEKPATAPEAAATEIVTEAETPAGAPTKSVRPKSKPTPPVKDADTPKPDEPKPEAPQTDAIADAVAAAVADTVPAAPVTPSGPPLSNGEKDALRVSVSKCWNLGSSSSEALATTVVVSVTMSQAGKPETITMLSSNGPNESATRTAYDAARRAIIRCGASGYNLPSEKYSQWQTIEMTFNPEKMRIK